MRLRVINQYPDLGATAPRLKARLSEFAKHPNAQFRCLVGFASAGGLRRLERSILAFLQSGGSIYVIVGLDLGGTSRDALECLLAWKRAFPKRVDVRAFTTGDNVTIFHPKVYWFDSPDRRIVLVGSSNATPGGLERNFEVSVEAELEEKKDSYAFEEFDLLWMTYSTPLPPLTAANLVAIDAGLIARVGAGSVPTDSHPTEPHPLAGVPRVSRRTSRRRVRPQRRRLAGEVELVMDILQETRQTQVQLPAGSLQSFFDTNDREQGNIQLRQVVRGSVVKSDVRPFIHLGNLTHRLEVDAIRGLPRPQIIRFWRSRSNAHIVFYEVALRGTDRYADLDGRLRRDGTQTRSGARRWLVRGL